MFSLKRSTAHRARPFLGIILVVLIAIAHPALVRAEGPNFRVGVIASLTGFAAPFGSAVVRGAKAAAFELERANGITVDLVVEDDRSELKGAAAAYQKLHAVDGVTAIVGGSWWGNGIVRSAERDGVLLLSCETLFNKDFVTAPNYFSLAGDLRDWVRAFEPLVDERGWHKAAMVRFVSGFAETLEQEMSLLFSKRGRTMLPSLVYSDIEMSGARVFATKMARSDAEVIFVDSQPASFAAFMREFSVLQRRSAPVIITHSVADDAVRDRLFDPRAYPGEIFFLRRSSYDTAVQMAFKRADQELSHNGDLGYYAVHLITHALAADSEDPVAALKKGFSVHGIPFSFDEHNVSHSIRQEVYTFHEGRPYRVGPTGKQRVALNDPTSCG